MFVMVKVPADGTSAKSTDMKDLLAPNPAGYVPHDMRVNGCERERLDAIDPAGHNAISENVKDEPRDIFITISSDTVSPQAVHEIAKLIAVLSDTDRDIHVNIV